MSECFGVRKTVRYNKVEIERKCNSRKTRERQRVRKYVWVKARKSFAVCVMIELLFKEERERKELCCRDLWNK